MVPRVRRCLVIEKNSGKRGGSRRNEYAAARRFRRLPVDKGGKAAFAGRWCRPGRAFFRGDANTLSLALQEEVAHFATIRYSARLDLLNDWGDGKGNPIRASPRRPGAAVTGAARR